MPLQRSRYSRLAALGDVLETTEMTAIAEIRCAGPHERHSLNELHRRASFVWEEDRAALEAHPDALGVALEAIAERRVRVAVDASGRPLGFSVVADGGRSICELDDLFVDSDAMRRGIGRALVEDAAARASAAGSERMTVVVHPRNFSFYETVGFVPGEPAQTRFGPAVRMWRELGTG
jgi:GNAT superfamily N-acetyltransferase